MDGPDKCRSHALLTSLLAHEFSALDKVPNNLSCREALTYPAPNSLSARSTFKGKISQHNNKGILSLLKSKQFDSIRSPIDAINMLLPKIPRI